MSASRNNGAAAAGTWYSANLSRGHRVLASRNPGIQGRTDQGAMAAKLEIRCEAALEGLLEAVELARAKRDARKSRGSPWRSSWGFTRRGRAGCGLRRLGTERSRN
jgi:hypothetical protein